MLTIITTVEQKDIHVVISVKDTGTGIDPEILPRLFTRFATKSESGTGTGLGLFISKSIVEAHGGRMWAENNSHEKGATFTFSLPLRKEKQLSTLRTMEYRVKTELEIKRICKYCGWRLDEPDHEILAFFHSGYWKEYRKDGLLDPMPGNYW